MILSKEIGLSPEVICWSEISIALLNMQIIALGTIPVIWNVTWGKGGDKISHSPSPVIGLSHERHWYHLFHIPC